LVPVVVVSHARWLVVSWGSLAVKVSIAGGEVLSEGRVVHITVLSFRSLVSICRSKVQIGSLIVGQLKCFYVWSWIYGDIVVEERIVVSRSVLVVRAGEVILGCVRGQVMEVIEQRVNVKLGVVVGVKADGVNGSREDCAY